MTESTEEPQARRPAAVEAGRSLPRSLVADIKPAPVKARAPLGVVELTIAPEQTLKCIGMVYGIEHEIRADEYRASLFLDQYNQRLRVLDYQAANYEALVLSLRFLAEANGFDKIIVMASHEDWLEFLRFGYVLEAVIRHYHRGADAYVVSKFRSQERLTSGSLMDEILLIEKLMAERTVGPPTPLPSKVHLRMARPGDVPALIELYSEIFETYPSPLLHTSYLETIIQKDNLFAVCTVGDRIVAAASAELHPTDLAAELTDCATRPEARGQGLMTHLLRRLEIELVARGYVCSYTMARARSFGMNAVFHRMGYEFMGRLVNNCDIFGAFEDMNIWGRYIGRPSASPTPALTGDSA